MSSPVRRIVASLSVYEYRDEYEHSKWSVFTVQCDGVHTGDGVTVGQLLYTSVCCLIMGQ